MTPADFMAEVVLPTALDFKTHRRSRRHAYLACIVAFTLKDHLTKAGEVKVHDALAASPAGEAFQVVRSIANGSKHVSTDATHVVTFRAGQDWDRPPAILGQLRLGVSRLGDATGGREVRTPSGGADLYASVRALLREYATHYPQHFSGVDVTSL